jgi:hypothetical protein
MLTFLAILKLVLLAESPGCAPADISILNIAGDESVVQKGPPLCLTTDGDNLSFSFLASVDGKKFQLNSPPLIQSAPSPYGEYFDYQLSRTDAENIHWEIRLKAGALRLKAGTLTACAEGGLVPSRLCATVPQVPESLLEWMAAARTISFGEGMTGPVLTGERFMLPPNVKSKPGVVVVRCTLTAEGTAVAAHYWRSATQ